MKNKYLLLIFLAIAFLSSCNEDKNLTDFIPADASFVVRIDNMEMMKKANLEKSGQSAESIGLMMKNFFKNSTNPSDIENTMKDPSSLGVDFRKDAYAFGTSSVEAISFVMNDAGKFKKALISAGIVTEENISKSKDINSFLYDDKTLISWDEKRLLILKNTSYEETELAVTARTLFSQKSKNSINENEHFKKFLEKKADISVFGTNELMSHLMKGGLGVSMKDQFSGMIPITYVYFNDGKILAETKVIFTNKDMEAKANEIFKDIFGYNSGKHLAYFDKMPDMLMTSNVKGENLKKFLTREGLSKQIGDIPIININDIVSNLNGDITVGTSANPDLNDQKPMMTILIDLKDPASIRSMFSQFSHPSFRVLQQTGEDSYKFFDGSFFVGIKDNMLYLSSDANFTQKSPQKNDVAKGFEDKIKQNKIFLYGNPSSTMALAKQDAQIMPQQNMFTSAFSLCESYTISATENLDITMEVNFTDKTQNSLAVILQNLDKISKDVEKNKINE